MHVFKLFKPQQCYHGNIITSSLELPVVENYSVESEDSSPGHQDSQSQASVASSKPELSDIYERSEEGDSDRFRPSGRGETKHDVLHVVH